MHTHRTFWTPALLALAVAVLAPAPGAAQDPAKEVDETSEEMVALPAPTVTVANHNWLDMHVYLVRASGGRTSLGMVTSQQTKRFEIPGSFATGPSDVHIVADPIGSSRPYVSPSFFPDPGTDVRVELQAALELSAIHARVAGSR